MYTQIYTYSLIRCLFNNGKDYIDSFYPLVLKVLPTTKAATIDDLKNDIKSRFSLDIPIYSLKIICNRAKKRNYLDRKGERYFITEQGKEYLTKLEPEKDELRRVNEFIEEAKKYIESKYNIEYSAAELEKLLEKIIKENIEVFDTFFGEGENHIPEGFTKAENAIIDFMLYVENSKPLLFRTLQDIISGGIISTVVYGDIQLVDKKLSNITIFFDANFLFCLLGLGYSHENQPVIELFNILKTQGNFEFRVFDFTIEEMVHVLKRYPDVQRQLPNKIKIDSIHSSLKINGFTDASVRELIATLETKLSKKGINIFSTQVDLIKYEASSSDRRTTLNTYKPNQGKPEQNHDMAAIEEIKKIRKSTKKIIENCEALFLTSDIRLSKFNYIEDSHKANGTISEVIPDRLLTNIMWLKNPKRIDEVHISSWISLNSRHNFIDRKVWQAFYENVKLLREKDKIDEFDVSILLYDNNFEDILKDAELKDVTEDMIMKAIDDAKARRNIDDQKIKKEISGLIKEAEKSKTEIHDLTKQRDEIVKLFTEEIEKRDRKYEEITMKFEKEQLEKAHRLNNLIIYMKKEEENKSETLAKNFTNVIVYLILIFLFYVLFQISGLIMKHWIVIEPVSFILSLAFSLTVTILGKIFEPFNLRLKIYDKLFQKIYSKKLKKVELYETMLL